VLWRQGEQPDVDDFLARVGRLTPAQVAAVLLVDQGQRWAAGKECLAERYVEKHPEILAEPDAALDLIYNEFLLREKKGEAPAVDAFLQRFPSQAPVLREQIELHLALVRHAAMDGTNVGQSPGDGREPPAQVLTVTQPGPTAIDRTATTPDIPGVGIPSDFGRYRVLRLLGRGGMGAVYHVHDTLLDRPVALKVIFFPSNDPRPAIERFHREARAAAALSHPHLCQVYDVGEVNGIPYLTMPLLSGKSLVHWIAAGPLAEKTAARLTAQAARALEAAHRAGVLHRDLKPSNILVNERDEPVVIDFGLALREGAEPRLTPSGGILGTPAYLPPEQVRGSAKSGPQTDIYSLGVVLYEMISGRVPFQGSLYDVLQQIVDKEPQPPSHHRPGLSPVLEAICLKAMSKSAAARFESMAAFAAALEGFCRQQEPHEVPGNAPQPPRVPLNRPSPRKWAIRVGLAAAAVLGIILVFLVLLAAFAPFGKRDTAQRDAAAALLHVKRAWQLNDSGKRDQAIEECDLALALDDQCGKALICRGNAQIEQGHYGRAVEDLTRAIELDPSDPTAYVDRAWAHNQRRAFDQALRDADEALRLNPILHEANYQKGSAYLGKEKYLQAVESLTQAIKLKSDYALAYLERSKAYRAMGKNDLAASDLRAARKYNPSLSTSD
jgi:tetratricopeptide (TPR) repeat protein/predicted Ser/Thr protein kinase